MINAVVDLGAVSSPHPAPPQRDSILLCWHGFLEKTDRKSALPPREILDTLLHEPDYSAVKPPSFFSTENDR